VLFFWCLVCYVAPVTCHQCTWVSVQPVHWPGKQPSAQFKLFTTTVTLALSWQCVLWGFLSLSLVRHCCSGSLPGSLKMTVSSNQVIRIYVPASVTMSHQTKEHKFEPGVGTLAVSDCERSEQWRMNRLSEVFIDHSAAHFLPLSEYKNLRSF
jgi:hypothetical protein